MTAEREAQQVADDALEASHAVAVALDVLIDARRALVRAGNALRAARAAALDVEARS